MPIQFKCDNCSRLYQLPDSAAGKQAKCECGELLIVPPATGRKPAPPRPPRTLNEAAAQAKRAREPTIDAAALEASIRDEAARIEAARRDIEPDIVAEPTTPPPLPDWTRARDGAVSSGAARLPHSGQAIAIEQKYPELRRHADGIEWSGRLTYIASIVLAVLAMLFGIGFAIERNTFMAMVPVTLISGVLLISGYSAYLFAKAMSQMLYVSMDTEENTRRTAISVSYLQRD
ncbi:hypothetical protein Pla108_40890 [Botrimarina colliarenosi]|uniref:Uncharacterized protein n=1 Tax=Botrimarina colliarenosi TaxID=2528001 RepID=A0A5C6A1T1_9BACT|nr:hypothetical protein [Botrimarina colliarenosi]TWT92463.1 hypothetical protein Pla108_40890 [Botrimarina colliarenosi]